MNRETFYEMNAREIEQAIDDLLPNGIGMVTSSRLRSKFYMVMMRVESHARNYTLLGLRTAEELAEEFNVTPRRMRAIIQNRHERWGTGRKVGSTWMVSADEIESVTPDKKYRRKSK